MKLCAAVLVSTVCFAIPSRAETPCDFKGISVGSKMNPAEIMAAFGVTKYKTNPARLSFEKAQPNIEKYGMLTAGEIEEWNIGPYCDESACHIPYGVSVGNRNGIPVNVHVGFYKGQIIEIDVSFGESFWDEVRPILDQKYGADWKADRDDMFAVTDYETKKSDVVERITLNHISNGTNQRTKDRCQIWATNFDLVFTHHDSLGRYHSQFVIKLISKNF